ncbi:MAG: HEAT repeat domain-containing protein [Planctomycetota bacterium]|nr:HEAT repeat domain-containing protein [Planctomycetota bacterium]MDA1178489.1 HEAT repeat domain-containing protein [Planctomycetota bacterium]
MKPELWLTTFGNQTGDRRQELIAYIQHASEQECTESLNLISVSDSLELNQTSQLETLVRTVLWRLLKLVQPEHISIPTILHLYGRLDSNSGVRGTLLWALAKIGTPASCAAFTELLVTDPVSNEQEIGQVLSHFFQNDSYDPQWLFPRLLDAMQHPAAATAVLDLANFLVRTGRVGQHPAKDRLNALRFLLENTTRQLQRLETAEATDELSPRQVAQRVNEGVALAISICNCFSLTLDTAASEALRDASALRHRRLRLAAATALARLGDDNGRTMVVHLAAEPSVRIAACQVAQEMQFEESIPSVYRSPIAFAEARLVNHLSHPIRFGLPPQECEIRDQRVLHWPGYDQPVGCYVFEFTYQFPEFTFRNMAVAGPVELTVSFDLTDWRAVDIYALAAGWQSEHPEMETWDPASVPAYQKEKINDLISKCQRTGDYKNIQPWRIARFWENWHVIATAEKTLSSGSGAIGTVVVGEEGRPEWFPQTDSARPVEPDMAYACYKGRLLLHAFNEPELLA